MAILTALRPDEIEQVISTYGLDVAEAKGVLAGSVNTSFQVVDGQGRRFWLRVYEEQDHRGASREARLLSRLAAAGVNTPSPLARVEAGPDGRFVATIRDKPACAFPFIEGIHRCQASVTTDDAALVGASLARVHRAGQAFTEADALTSSSRFSIGDIRARLTSLSGRGLPAELEAARRRLEQQAERLAQVIPKAAPLALIHGDLFRDNVLFTPDGSVSLLDFESASTGQAAFDLMVTTLSWCFGDDLDRELARALFRGYAAIRPLDAAEIGELWDQGRIACIRFATTRMSDYELRPRDQGVYKDYRRFLARLRALDELGSALPRFLGL